MNTYSQYKQDLYIYERFFKTKSQPGFYVEIGVLDGIEISNSLLFQNMGWKGLCIEANPYQYSLLEKNRNHINTTCFFGAAYSHDCTLDFRVNDGYTTSLSGIEKSYNPEHKKRIETENNMYNCSSKIIQVPAYKTQNIFDKFDIKHIDYLSIDVEGSEYDILEGIDFTRTHINVITVEDNYNESMKFIKKLEESFDLVGKIGQDLLFVNKIFKN